MRRLTAQTPDAHKIEVEERIRSFERYAKKYKVRYHVEKDVSVSPPKWTVYFKASQADAIEAAFKKYTQKTVKRENRAVPSLPAIEIQRDGKEDGPRSRQEQGTWRAGTMKVTDILKKYVLPNLPYLIFLWFFAKVGEAVRLAPGVDASAKLLGLADGFTLAFQTSMPGAAVDWLIGLIGAAEVRLVVYVKGKNAKKYRKDVEYGSARWGTKADIAPFMDPKPENNIILTPDGRADDVRQAQKSGFCPE